MPEQKIYEDFISILERNIGIILKIARVYTNTLQDREDLIHDITLQMWKAFPGFEGRSKVSTWIYRIALNTALNYRRNSRKNHDFIDIPVDLLANKTDADSASDAQIELLYESIAELDEFNKAIILLYLDGKSHEEIAEISGISKTNVGTRISRIKEQLRNLTNSKQKNHGT